MESWTFDAHVKDGEAWANQILSRATGLVDELSPPWYARQILDAARQLRAVLARQDGGEIEQAAVRALQLGALLTEARLKFEVRESERHTRSATHTRRDEPEGTASAYAGEHGTALNRRDTAWQSCAVKEREHDPDVPVAEIARRVARKFKSNEHTVRRVLRKVFTR